MKLTPDMLKETSALLELHQQLRAIIALSVSPYGTLTIEHRVTGRHEDREAISRATISLRPTALPFSDGIWAAKLKSGLVDLVIEVEDELDRRGIDWPEGWRLPRNERPERDKAETP